MGIGEDVDAVELDEERGVTDPGDRRPDPVRAQVGTVVGQRGERLAPRGPALDDAGEQAHRATGERVGVLGIGIPESVTEMMRELGGGRSLGGGSARIEDQRAGDDESHDDETDSTN